MDLGQEARDSRAQKRVPKSPQQAAKICMTMSYLFIQLNKIIRLFNHITVEALQKNYIFAALNQRDLEACMLSMEFVEISKGDNIITQGFRVISC